MPAGLIFHKADAAALDGVGQNDDGLIPRPASLFECTDQRLHVVAVHSHRLPSEARVLVGQRFHLHHVFHPSIDLQAIAINHGDEVGEAVVAGLHGGFPHLAFLLFAVAHQAKNFVLFAIEARSQRHAH